MRFNLKTICIATLLAITHCPTQAQDTRTTIETFPNYPYVLIVPEGESLHMSDSLFFAHSRGVIFKVNRTELSKSDKFFNDYRKLLPKLWDGNILLRGAFVRGGASPEGPYYNNVRLAKERTSVLMKEVRAIADSFKFVMPLVASTSSSEDFNYLLSLMKSAKDPDYNTVDSICTLYKGREEDCKKAVKAIAKGKLWARLLKEYFPQVRRSAIVLWGWHHDNSTIPLPPPARHEPIPEPVIPQIHLELPSFVRETLDSMPLPRKRMLALRTNLIHDFLWLPNLGWALTPNLQAEYFPLYGHFTINGGFSFSQLRHWGNHKFYQMRDARLELRRYFRGGGTFEGLYLGAYGEYTKYGIGFNRDKGWEGEGGGGGLSLGHTLRLNHRGSLRLEFSLSAGYFYTQYDPYVYGNPKTGIEDGKYYYNYKGERKDFKRRNHYRSWIGPTNAGIHITYDILYHKRGAGIKKGGDR